MIKNILIWLLVPVICLAGTWNWQNPVPQGNTLCKIAFFNEDYGYAVGDYGTILFSSDKGLSWEEQNEGMTDNLYDLSVVDSINVWVVGDNGVVLRTTDGGNNWVDVSVNFDAGLNAVCFLNSQYGFVCGDGNSIFKTTNAGASWTSKSVKQFSINENLLSIWFVSETNGWVIADNGALASTVNGGSQWTIQHIFNRNITCIRSFGNNVIVCGEGGFVSYSTNSGSSWTTSNTNTAEHLNHISIKDPSNILISGDNGIILKSTDSGVTWSKETINTYASILGIDVVSGTKFVVGDNGFYGYGSSVWTIQNDGMSDAMNTLAYSDQMKGFCAGLYGKILKTSDGGKSWQNIDNKITGDSFFGSFANGSKVWICGESGVVLFSSDEGGTWTQQLTNTTSNLNCLFFYDEMNGWTGGDNGELYSTTDGGNKWSIVPTGKKNNIFGVKFYNMNLGAITGTGGLISITTNGGKTWNAMYTGTTASLNDFCQVNQTTAFVCGESGIILRTTTGGLTWTKLTTGSNQILHSIDAGQGSFVYAVGDTGTLIYSSDNGNTWLQDSLFPTRYNLYSLKAFSDTLVTIAGDFGSIIGKGTPRSSTPKPKVIQLLVPFGGENWKVGTQQTLQWHTENIQAISVYYSTDNRSTWKTITNNLAVTNTSYQWLIPNDTSSQCFIKIEDVTDSKYFSTNGNPFKIQSDAPVKNITLVRPFGGDKFYKGDTMDIIWNSTNIDTISIMLSIDGKQSWKVISVSVPANSGDYKYYIPKSIGTSSSCFVKVADRADNSISSGNINAFSIIDSVVVKELKITSQLSSEKYFLGDPITITWQNSNVDNLDILFSNDGKVTWTTIASKINAVTGSYIWQSDSSFSASNKCYFKLKESGNDTISDISGSFTLQKRTDVYTGSNQSDILISDNEGEIFISILGDDSYIYSVEIYNLMGDIIKTENSGGKSADILLVKHGELSSGVYYLKITTGGGISATTNVFMRKLVIVQ